MRRTEDMTEIFTNYTYPLPSVEVFKVVFRGVVKEMDVKDF
jgi:hypothetical protein